ncbi:hypothetical protein G4G27_02080 [Sphingomonas sp. So64.6b]|uniref:hypothetical protein n=1 Tax=Sphingomonas sp. So64.6b TaxID=2997354 RepID=UPI0015FEDBCC|nr:hypothetical protein [Sphingomonas sp. So64.6b]QNA82933.1 hypothetical protein G4G27_02080 [Sphingomonas sp. So64.6b]
MPPGFGDLLAALRLRLGGVDDTPEQVRSHMKAAADVFNEHGFFQTARGLEDIMLQGPGSALPRSSIEPAPDVVYLDEAPALARLPVDAPVGQGALPADLADAQHPESLSEERIAAMPNGAAMMPMTPGLLARPLGAGQPSVGGSLGATPVRHHIPVRVEARPTTRGGAPAWSRGVRPDPPQRPAPLNGAALKTQVSVQASEHGIDILARIEKFSLSERASLRERMIAMLSRHGLTIHDVRINGDPGTPSSNDQGQ